jgi:ATP-binding cassette subfamily B protein
VSLSRVYELLDTPPDVVDPADPIRLTTARGLIEFDHVSVDLGRGPVLSSVSFAIAPGELVALVGASGIGKSTIADLMVRLIDPGQGIIRLDGVDLNRLALADVRRYVVLVDQAPILFHATIAQNIRYACPEVSSAQLQAAASAAGLDELIARLPEGLDTIVGERGAALSAGERQRIALARALLLDPAVLVLDEPTAALDPASERQVLAGYEGVMRGRTTLVITHHAAVAAAADRVLVLGNAGIVEQGAADELRTRDGAFATLFATT